VATVVSIVATIVVFFLVVMVAASLHHKRKLRAAKKELQDFIDRFRRGDPDALVSRNGDRCYDFENIFAEK
jgi:pilus assembly protein TadC